MPETPNPSALSEVQTRLREVARILRESSATDPASRLALRELVEELHTTLESTPAPAAEVAHLAESTAHLAEALHRQEEHPLPPTVRDRLAQAAFNAEAQAPLAAGLAHRFLAMLANIGI
jgi:hypothetical protein